MSKIPTYTLETTDWYLDPAAPEDVNCIVNDWAASEATENRRDINEEIFKVGIRERIARLLQAYKAAVIRPTPEFFAKHEVEPQPFPIMGWAVYGWDVSTQQPVIHFIYIKGKYRGNGLARVLLQQAAAVEPGTFAWTTHKRRWLIDVIHRYGMEYNPFLLERRK